LISLLWAGAIFGRRLRSRESFSVLDAIDLSKRLRFAVALEISTSRAAICLRILRVSIVLREIKRFREETGFERSSVPSPRGIGLFSKATNVDAFIVDADGGLPFVPAMLPSYATVSTMGSCDFTITAPVVPLRSHHSQIFEAIVRADAVAMINPEAFRVVSKKSLGDYSMDTQLAGLAIRRLEVD